MSNNLNEVKDNVSNVNVEKEKINRMLTKKYTTYMCSYINYSDKVKMISEKGKFYG